MSWKMYEIDRIAHDLVLKFRDKKEVQVKPYRISWRLVTNSGQDAGVIRPVMGAGRLGVLPWIEHERSLSTGSNGDSIIRCAGLVLWH